MEPLHKQADAHGSIDREQHPNPRTRAGRENHGGANNDDSFNSLRPPSITSITTGSWESGDGETGRMLRRPDRRKFIDTTTPTLIDEHDVSEDEEEMVSLDRERWRREMMMMHGDAQTQREATDVSESASVRRTPGAIAMQNSSRHTSVSATEVTDAALLGFGLTLTTPVAASAITKKAVVGKQLSADSFSSSSASSQAAAVTRSENWGSGGDRKGPPLAIDTRVRSHDPRDSRSYTPAGWTLSKNPHLEVSHGAFSPNTLRLTEDLDNLLLDEEDGERNKQTQHVFRDPVKGSFSIQASISAIDEADEQPMESWSAPYIFGQDGGKAENVKVAKGKFRKAKNEGGRRSRSGDMGKESGTGARAVDASDVAHAHPKPLRQGQGKKIENGFATSGFASHAESSKPYQDRSDEDDGRRPLNFGGAFVPPSKSQAGNFRRPVASTLRSSNFGQASGASGSQRQTAPSPGVSQMGATQAYSGGFRPASSPFQSMNPPHYLPQFSGGDNSLRHPSQPPAPRSGYGSVTPVNYGNSSFGGSGSSTPVNYANATYGSSIGHVRGHGHSMTYQSGLNPYAAPMGQPTGQTTIPMSAPHSSSQHWSQTMPYSSGMAARESGWHGGSASRSWGNTSDYGYGYPGPGMMDSRLHSTPSPQFAPGWQDHGYGGMEGMHYPSQQMSSQGFGGPSQSYSDYHGFSGEASVPASTQGNESGGNREPKNIDGTEDRAGSKKQRSNDKKKSSSTKEKSKGVDLDRKKKPGSPKKKKQSKTRGSSPTKASARKDGQDIEGMAPVTKDVVDTKRNEIDGDPAARAAYKEFYRQFREKERQSFKEGEEFAKKALAENTLPETVHWRVHLELADLAKRSNRIAEARQLYRRVCELQPYVSQGWLEYSKLEEECGHLNKCARILKNGLEYCEYSESLLTRAIKHAEKMGNLDMARQLLARLKHVGIEKVWKLVLEGALLEARAGNTLMARRVMKYLMHHVFWHGPLYFNAYLLERDQGRLEEALVIVEKGLTKNPKYGPLWFGAFRLCEALDLSQKAYHLPRTTSWLGRVSNNISRDLVWKVHLDAAQIFERAAICSCDEKSDVSLDEKLDLCRERFALTAFTCPSNLSWKVWLAGGRMELSAGNPDKARALFLRARQVVPEKSKAVALLEFARLEEFLGNVDVARAILTKSRLTATSDWKIWLESVLLEVRSGHPLRAIEIARLALVNHNGTGRLWACLVQLRHYDFGEEAQLTSLKRALMAVPKSGEVWCEGGRIHLNPFSNTFDLTEARRHLFFATRFTPQYGDSFLETMKLEILEQWIAPVALNMWQVLQPAFLKRLIEDKGCDSDEILADVVQTVARKVRDALWSDHGGAGSEGEESDADTKLLVSLRRVLTPEGSKTTLDNSELEQRCSNAGPNYGLLWFHSRNGPVDTARTIIVRGREKMIDEVISSAHLYVAAMVRRYAIITFVRHQNQIEMPNAGESKNEVIDSDELEEWEALLDSRLRAAPSLASMLQPGKEIAGTVLLESSVTASDYVTGYVELNKYRPLETMSLRARRKALFGSDALFS